MRTENKKYLSGEQIADALILLGEDPTAARVDRLRGMIDATTLCEDGDAEAVRAAVDAARKQLDGPQAPTLSELEVGEWEIWRANGRIDSGGYKNRHHAKGALDQVDGIKPEPLSYYLLNPATGERLVSSQGQARLTKLGKTQAQFFAQIGALELPKVGAEYRSTDSDFDGTVTVRSVSCGRVFYEGDADGSALLEEFRAAYAPVDAMTLELPDPTRPENMDLIRRDLATLVEMNASGDNPVFRAELAGYAAQAAAKELLENWDAALGDDPEGKIVGNLMGDVDDTIAFLKEFRDRATAILPARFARESTPNPEATVRIDIPAEMPEFASDQSYGPPMRVARLVQAMKAWRVADQSVDDAPDGIETDDHVAICMLADLRHYCDAKGLDFAQMDRHAYVDYSEQVVFARAESPSSDL